MFLVCHFSMSTVWYEDKNNTHAFVETRELLTLSGSVPRPNRGIQDMWSISTHRPDQKKKKKKIYLQTVQSQKVQKENKAVFRRPHTISVTAEMVSWLSLSNHLTFLFFFADSYNHHAIALGNAITYCGGRPKVPCVKRKWWVLLQWWCSTLMGVTLKHGICLCLHVFYHKHFKCLGLPWRTWFLPGERTTV